jgi:hypothetical protein
MAGDAIGSIGHRIGTPTISQHPTSAAVERDMHRLAHHGWQAGKVLVRSFMAGASSLALQPIRLRYRPADQRIEGYWGPAIALTRRVIVPRGTCQHRANSRPTCGSSARSVLPPGTRRTRPRARSPREGSHSRDRRSGDPCRGSDSSRRFAHDGAGACITAESCSLPGSETMALPAAR